MALIPAAGGFLALTGLLGAGQVVRGALSLPNNGIKRPRYNDFPRIEDPMEEDDHGPTSYKKYAKHVSSDHHTFNRRTKKRRSFKKRRW